MTRRPLETPDSNRYRPVLEPEAAAGVLRAIYAAGLLGALGISLSAWIGGHLRIVALGGSGALTLVALLLLSRPAQVPIAGAMGTFFMLAIVVWATVTGYGIRDLTFPAFAFVILLGNLVLSRGWAWVATGTVCLTSMTIALAEYLGALKTPTSQYTSGTSVVIVTAVTWAIALTARRIVRAYHEGLERIGIQELGYRHIFNATTEAILLVDPNTERIVDVNESAENMLGYSRQEFLRSSLQLLAAKHQSAQHVVEMMEAGMKGEPLLFEWTVNAKDGSERAVEVSLRPTRVETKNVLLAVMRDTTEARRIQAKLQETEKLQAVGQLAGGIAHDFNNQLTGILANASLLKEKLTDPRLQKCAEVIERCSRRSADLTAQLLAFARRGKHQNVDVDLHDLVAEVVELLKHTIDKRITLEAQISQRALHVTGDPTLLQNALLNLGLNACDAMPDGGTLRFLTGVHEVETTQTGLALSLSHGNYAKIQVSDTGVGMNEETLKRIFEPFFTTKAEGNGMGLAAVYGAMESHKGDISVESVVGRGTTFTMLLPLSERTHESVRLPTPVSHFDGIRILLAEDEHDVARATIALLEELGCEVTRCENGIAAVEVFASKPDAFDLVIVDHMMPGLSGREALREMKALAPNLRAVITSGYSNEAVIENENAETQHFLPKPFTATQMSACLNRVLEVRSQPEHERPLPDGATPADGANSKRKASEA